MTPLMASSYNTTCQLINCNNPFNQTSFCGVDKPSSGKQLSPTNKALRVTMLKARFADIILKAQQTLNNNAEKEDPAKLSPEKVNFVEKQQKKNGKIESQLKDDKVVIALKTNSNLKMKILMKRDATFLSPNKEGINKAKMQHEKKDFTEEQQEKKRRIEAQVKATKASIDEANSKSKMKIQKEREAARLALEKVEASIYIDDFNQTYKDYMMLISSQSDGVK